MLERFTSKPLELPGDEDFDRADLIFYGIDHSGESFEGLCFLSPRSAIPTDAGRDHPAYVGSFFILGHGGCFGDPGHCDIPEERDPFDFRPPDQLLPAIRILTVTDAIRKLVGTETRKVRVTVIARTAAKKSNEVLEFDTARLATYIDEIAPAPVARVSVE